MILPSVLLVAAWMIVAQWISSPAFDPANFEKVQAGMTHKQVRSLLGRPDRRFDQFNDTEAWRYDDGKWLFTIAIYYIYFVEDHVADTKLDWR